MRLRSQLAGCELARKLTAEGYCVEDCIIYKNHRKPLPAWPMPEFEAVFFASSSAVEAFMAIWPASLLAERIVAAMGKPTLAALERYGVAAVHIPADASVRLAIKTLAATIVSRELEKIL